MFNYDHEIIAQLAWGLVSFRHQYSASNRYNVLGIQWILGELRRTGNKEAAKATPEYVTVTARFKEEVDIESNRR